MKLVVPVLLSLGAVVANAGQIPLGNQQALTNDESWQIITGEETIAGLGKPNPLFSNPWEKVEPKSKPKSGSKNNEVTVKSEQWQENGRTFIQDVHQNAVTGESVRKPVFELLKHEAFPKYQIRMRQPQLCDPNVKQYSGYLDISEEKHLFFW